MGKIFYQNAGQWSMQTLPVRGALLATTNETSPLVREDEGPLDDWQARFLSVEVRGSVNDLVLVRRRVSARINGRRVTNGLAVLQGRACLTIERSEYFYSSEMLVVIEHFAEGQPPLSCPRCNGEITSGQIIRCPGCKTVFHQSEERPCFTYSPQCPLCNASTNLDEEQWSPADL